MHEWLEAHGELVGVALALLLAYNAVGVFRVGVALGTARGIRGEAQRAVSEALGG